jgi:hypothetical protein
MERLALIEVFDPEGRHQNTVWVNHWPVTVGRALDCDVVLGDPHVAAHHATLAPDASDPAGTSRLQLRVGDSRNGVRLSGPRLDQQVAAGGSAAVPPGTMCHFGRSALRVRLAGEPLEEEMPLAAPGGRWQLAGTVAGGIAVLAWMAAQQWLQNEPGSGWDKYVPPLLGALVGAVLWSALWGLGSKIFQRHFRIAPHLRVLLAFLLASMALDLFLALAAYSLGVPLLSHIRGWVEIAMVAALLAGHAAVLLPGHEKTVRLSFAALCVAVLGIDGGLTWRHHQRLFDEQFAAALPPPALRLVAPRPIDALLAEMRAAHGTLDRRAREDEDNDSREVED